MPAQTACQPGPRRQRARWAARAALASILVGLTGECLAADPARGERLYGTAPAPGLLACFECHGEAPAVNNFGNIFAGHNAVALIQRAVASNTGGMGYFSAHYTAADLADIAAYLGNTPARLDFPDTASGATSPARRVSISPGTKADIRNLSLVIEGDFGIAATDCGVAVERFGRCEVDVVFQPRAAGPRSGALLIAHEGTPTPVRIHLSGTALARPPAVARLSPARLDFPATAPGGAGGPRRALALTNDSDEPLSIAGVDSSGSAFRIAGGDCLEGRVLGAGESCAIVVAFEPRRGGPAHGAVLVRHDGLGARSRAALSGTAAPGATVTWRAEPEEVDFGAAESGRRAGPRTLSLRNVGAATIAVDNVVSERAEFEVLAHDCDAAPLAPGDACRVVAAMRPVRAGAVSGRLAVVGNGTRTAVGVLLHGSGAPPGAGIDMPARLDFGAPAGGTSVRSAWLVQQGGETAVIDDLVLEGADAMRFDVLPAEADGDCSPGTALPPAAGCRVRLRYVPVGEGPHSAGLRVSTRGVAMAARMALHGRVAPTTSAAAWTVDAFTLEFGSQAGTRTLTVRHTGTDRWLPPQARVVPAAGSGFSVRGGTCTTAPAVPPGQACTLEIGFEPAPSRLASATLVLQAQGSAAVAAVSMTGHAAAAPVPRLRFDSPLAAFGTQSTGWPASRTIAVRNVGAAAADPPRFEVTGSFRIARIDPACTAPLPPGSGCALEVQMQADAPGSVRGLLRASSGGSTARIALTGTAVSAAGRLVWQSAAALGDAAPTPVGDHRPGEWHTLVNAGSVQVEMPRWRIAGPSAWAFSIDPASACLGVAALQPGAACSMRVLFHPHGPGSHEASLQAADDEPGPEALALRGTAHGQPLVGLELRPAWLRLAAVPGARTAPAYLWLANAGATTAVVEGLEVLGDAFGLAPAAADAGPAICGPRPFALVPGQGCAVSVEWDGSASGQQGGSLRVVASSGEVAESALAIVEEASERRNQGAGGGAASPAWVLGLVGATLWLAMRRRRDAESRHERST